MSMLSVPNSKPLAITVNSATKRYGETIVLDSVSLDVEAGEFVTLLGPSGSGKTTLLNIIAGFTHPEDGSVYFGDENVTDTPPHKRGIGIVFQNYALFPHMNVAENLAFPMKARRLPSEEIARSVEWALSLVQLDGYGTREIDQLSGGQKQRVALARAVVFRPKLILMDEPLSALDKQLREQMQIEIRNLHERIGATTIYVTHDQREALTMSSRIAVLNKGHIVQFATPRELYDHPTDAFVAEFIGEAMLAPVTRQDDHTVLLEGRPIRSSCPISRAPDLVLVVRSEKLRLAQCGAENVIEAVVRRHVYQGESQLALLELDSGLTFTYRQTTHVDTDALLPAEGQRARFSLHPEHAVVVPRTAATA
jgi:putative spermidine/putrescine transport system ATP-binding protein